MKLLIVLAAVVVQASIYNSPGQPWQAQYRHSGLYSNMYLSPETGDLGGYEIEIHAEVTEPYALFANCEGWCNTYYRVPIEVDGDSFEFSYSQILCDLNGSMFRAEPRRLFATVTGNRLILEDREGPGARQWTLSATTQRFGLEMSISEAETACGN